MRYTLSDVGDSWTATLLFAIGLGVVVFGIIVGEGSGSFGAPVGSVRWWLGVGAAVFAILVTLGSRLR